VSVYDIGDVATLDFTVTLDGALVDPTTVTLTVTDPDGTETTPTPTHVSTGTYTFPQPVTAAGTWTYQWATTGVGQTSESGDFEALTAELSGLLRDTKERLNKTLAVDDEEIVKMLRSALVEYAEWVGPVGDVTETFSGGTDRLVLRAPKVAEITAAGYADGSVIDVADLLVDNGIVYWGYGTAGFFTWGTRNVTVSYTVGPLPLNHRETIVADVAGYFEATQGGTSSNAAAFPGEGFDEAPYRTSPMVLFPRIRALAPTRVA
jgi:hypothetical protein